MTSMFMNAVRLTVWYCFRNASLFAKKCKYKINLKHVLLAFLSAEAADQDCAIVFHSKFTCVSFGNESAVFESRLATILKLCFVADFAP